MGREVRKVPEWWKHPADEESNYIPLLGGNFKEADEGWMESWKMWQQGLRENYGDGEKWVPISEKYKDTRYKEYAGPRPCIADYMPEWPEEERTHFMMYETCSEGTPISPSFKTPEELARWLADNNASAFADQTATYEQWLQVAKGRSAPSAVIHNGVMESGVAALADEEES